MTILVVLMAFLSVRPSQAEPSSRIAKRVLRADATATTERLVNPGMEEAGDQSQPARGWGFWEEGYSLETEVVRTGRAAARCTSTDPSRQYGVAQTVLLNQAKPLPVLVSGWSRAESVSGTADAGYSVYVDIEFTDGDHLWGQTATFDTGTHDWQFRRVVVVPEKPIARLTAYGLFRGHTGTAYFDDFSVAEPILGDDAALFDGVAVTSGEPPLRIAATQSISVPGLSLAVCSRTGAVSLRGGPTGGFLLRDVGADSDFLQPREAAVTRDGGVLTVHSTCSELGLELWARFVPMEQAIRIDGELRDKTGADRAIAVYFFLPTDFVGGEYGWDMRNTLKIEPGFSYANTVSIGVGTNGRISRYPLLPVARGTEALCIATPLDVPRVSRLSYDADSCELYGAFDLGLSPTTRKFPSSATFSLVLYRFDSAWGFRAALKRYYELFPAFFEKRVEREGIWMPFTDIATIPNAADFGFAFKEGDDNVPWDEAHGIYTFVYTEPMSHWLPLANDIPRTYDSALAELKRRATNEAQSQATLASAYMNPDGSYHLWILKAPWCDGALITCNPDPDLFSDRASIKTQAHERLAAIEQAFRRAERRDTAVWRHYGGGFDIVETSAHEGSRCVRCTNAPGEAHGASQVILLNQTEPREIVARAWSRAEGVTGTPDNDYSLYLDLIYADGTPSYGHVAPFPVGTYDWAEARVAVRPEKPIRALILHLLFRGGHAGTVWFDDVSLIEDGNTENLVAEPGFEGPEQEVTEASLDGTYIDSYEMAATEQNYRREHWAYVDLPITFSQTTRELCSLGVFHTYEFERELAERMHSRGKLVFANAVLNNFAFPAHLLDVLGIETDWAPGGNYTPNSDEIINFRRALCYQKPYVLLLNTDYQAFKPEWVERYFKRCAFYAVFPSFFSHNAADDPYWQNETLYNRDRPLFRKYIPVIRDLSAAGWQPITHARVSSRNGKVYVERYGSDPKAGIYFTLFNDSMSEQGYSLKIDARALRIDPSRTTVLDVLTNRPVALMSAAEKVGFRGTLQAEDLRVIQLRRR